MQQKHKKAIIISLLSVFIVASAVSLISIFSNTKSSLYDINQEEVKEAYGLLKQSISRQKTTYYDFCNENNDINYTLNTIKADNCIDNVVSDIYNHQAFSNQEDIINSLNYGQTLNYSVNVATAGLYEINLDYLIKGDNVLNAPNIQLIINNNS